MPRRRTLPIAIPLPPEGVDVDDLIVMLTDLSRSYEGVRVQLESRPAGPDDVVHLSLTASRRRVALEPELPLDPTNSLDRRILAMQAAPAEPVLQQVPRPTGLERSGGESGPPDPDLEWSRGLPGTELAGAER